MEGWKGFIVFAFVRTAVVGVLSFILTICVFRLLQLENVWLWGSLVGCSVAFFNWLKFSEPEPEPVAPVIVQEPDTFRLEVDYDSGAAGDYLQFGVDPRKFFSWCEGVSLGRSTAEDNWCGSRGIFAKSEYRTLRDELVTRGFMRLRGKSPSQGYELSAKGSALVRGVARTHAHATTSSTKNVTW